MYGRIHVIAAAGPNAHRPSITPTSTMCDGNLLKALVELEIKHPAVDFVHSLITSADIYCAVDQL